MRDIDFKTGSFYHVYNRGANKDKIFHNRSDFNRFKESIVFFNNEDPIGGLYHLQFNDPLRSSATKLVEVCAYCLCGNHFHLLLKQLKKDGVSRYMHKLGTGYTRYFNIKHHHSGHVFEGRFKAKEAENGNYLFWLSAYINGNAEIHGLAKAHDWLWSSYQDYFAPGKGIINSKEILEFFSKEYKHEKYSDYVKGVIIDSKKRKKELVNLEF